MDRITPPNPSLVGARRRSARAGSLTDTTLPSPRAASGTVPRVIAVVADSAANLPPDVAGSLGIAVVPMYVHLGDRSFRDGVDLSPRQLYERLSAGAAPATTSTPAPADFLAAFRGSEANGILCVTVAASMSSSHGQAIAASDEFAGTVEVVDSLSASMAEGFVAMAAARAAARGAPLAEVARRARAAAAATRLFATVDTFDHLQRSGRVSRLQAYAATALDINPVFAFREGRPSALARPPDTPPRAGPRRRRDHRRPPQVEPCGWPPSTRWRRTKPTRWPTASASAVSVLERFVVEVTPVVGVHVGPGLVGAAIHPDPA